jgi:hypothetical protein
MIYRIHKKKTLKHVNPVMPFAALPPHTAVGSALTESFLLVEW